MKLDITMNSAIIKCDHLEIGYGVGLVPPFDLVIERSDFLCITGPNGSGKSTLIKSILGMIPAVSGKIEFPSGRPVFGYVPQQKSIASDHPVTVFDTVMMGKYGMRFFAKITDSDRSEITGSLKIMGVEDLAPKQFSALSGGQKQRVLTARALVAKPEVLILDEPAQGMDASGEKSLFETIGKLNRESRTTVILITHQTGSVSGIANKYLYIGESGVRK